MSEVIEHEWLGRLQVVGRAQARYLWVLLTAGVFFWALHVEVSAGDSTVSLPVLDVEAGGRAVWAFGPAVLAYLILIVMGSLRAYKHALESAGLTKHDIERFDTAPNALDLAAYTTKQSPNWVRLMMSFKYPVFLSIFVFEAAILEATLVQSRRSLDLVLAVLGAGLLATAAYQVLSLWRSRVEAWQEDRKDRGSTS